MAVIGTLRIPNMTPFARTELVVTNIPLPQGFMSDGSAQRLTARSAFNGIDVPVQIMQPARLANRTASVSRWPDDSWRVARICFPATLPAATSGRFGYDLYTEVEVDIVEGGQDLPPFAIHPDLDLAKLGLRLTCQIYDPDYQTSGVERSITFSATNGRITDHRPPYSVSTPAAAEEWDTAQIPLSQGWMHAFRVSGRIMPEEFGGPPEEPSMCATFIYEVPNASIAGVGRIMRAWCELANSHVVDNSVSRSLDAVHGVLEAPPTIDLLNLDGEHRWLAQVDQSGTFTTGQDNQPARARVQFLDPYRVPDRNSHFLPYLYGRVLRMRVLASGNGASLTPEESSTWSAIQHGNGSHAFPDAVSKNWHQHQDSYGPYGVAFSFAEVGWEGNEDGMRSEVARVTRTELSRYASGDAYFDFPSHVNKMAAAGSGNHPNFSAFGLQAYQACTHPDLRSVWLSMTTECHRMGTWRNPDGEPTSFRDDFDRPDRPAVLYSGQLLYEGRIFPAIVTSGRFPWATTGGKLRSPDVRFFVPGGRPNANQTGYTFIDHAHVAFGHAYAYLYLTGDRWMTGRRALDMYQHSFNMKQSTLRETGGWFPSVESMHGISAPRSEGRVTRCRAQAAFWSWDPVFFDIMADRVEQLDRFNTNGDPAGLRQGLLDFPIGTLTYDGGGFTQRYLCDFPLTKAWNNDSPEARQTYAPWQQAMMAEGFYVAYRVLNASGVRQNAVAVARRIAEKLARSNMLFSWQVLPGGGRRPWYQADLGGNGHDIIPEQYHSQTFQYCSYNSDTGQLKLESDLFGPSQINRAASPGGPGFPRFWLPRSDYVPYVMGPIMIAAVMLPNDQVVQDKVRELFVEHRVIPTVDELRDWVCDYDGGYLELGPIVPDAFGRWTSATGPRTYDESAAVSVEFGFATSEIAERVESATVTVDLVATADERLVIVYEESATVSIDQVVSASETTQQFFEETATVDIALGGSASETLSKISDETANGDVDVVGAAGHEFIERIEFDRLGFLVDESLSVDLDIGPSVSGGGALYDETIDVDVDFLSAGQEEIERSDDVPAELVSAVADGAQTIDEAIGRDRQRARGVRVYRDSYGNPSRTTHPGPWRGTSPTRRTFHPDARIDDV